MLFKPKFFISCVVIVGVETWLSFFRTALLTRFTFRTLAAITLSPSGFIYQ
jgi:hypothetical protein